MGPTVQLLDKLIQDRLEILPRAIEGKTPYGALENKVAEIKLLRGLKQHWLLDHPQTKSK